MKDGDPPLPTPPPFTVAAVQMDVRLGDAAFNLERLGEFAREAAREDARLVVFPECVLTGYVFPSLEEARKHAQSIPGPSTGSVETLCRELGIHVVYGLLEEAPEGVFNALALVGPEGLVASYRKVHLPHLGVDHHVAPGDRPFAVHETPLARIGLNICYDGVFPEAARLMALDGADIILLPTNWPEGAEEFALYAINTRALENKVYYVAADRVGSEGGFRFIGLSRIVDAHGRTLAEADGTSETLLFARIDPAEARLKTIHRVPGKHWIDRLADRRPEFYGPLAEPPRASPP